MNIKYLIFGLLLSSSYAFSEIVPFEKNQLDEVEDYELFHFYYGIDKGVISENEDIYYIDDEIFTEEYIDDIAERKLIVPSELALEFKSINPNVIEWEYNTGKYVIFVLNDSQQKDLFFEFMDKKDYENYENYLRNMNFKDNKELTDKFRYFLVIENQHILKSSIPFIQNGEYESSTTVNFKEDYCELNLNNIQWVDKTELEFRARYHEGYIQMAFPTADYIYDMKCYSKSEDYSLFPIYKSFDGLFKIRFQEKNEEADN